MHLVFQFSKQCGLSCKIHQQLNIPEYAFDKARNQYNAKMILKKLLKDRSSDSSWFMGVTAFDLYVPILKYIFGLANTGGPCFLISLYRLRPQFYNKATDNNLFITRIKKTAIHELGHTMGLVHCRNQNCVMYSSCKIEDTDNKNIEFCSTCHELFRWNIANIMTH